MRVIPAKLVRPHRLGVAAYARVSTDHEKPRLPARPDAQWRVTEHENRGTSRAHNVDNTDVRECPGRQPGSGSELVRAELRGLVDVKNADFVAKLVPGRGCK